MNLLEMCGVGIGYRNRVVIENLDFRMPAGELAALIGPNGCGKSTLLRAIVGESVNRTGVIRHNNEDISALATDRIVVRGIGYLKQSRNVFPSLTVGENLSLATMERRTGDQSRHRRVMAAFPAMTEKRGLRAGLLSGGQRQMLAVAMIISRPVSLLLLDEPLAGLAQQSAMELLEGLSALQRQEGFGMLIVEHRLKLVQPYVSRVVVMNRGAIVVDTEDTSILSDRSRLEEYYAL